MKTKTNSMKWSWMQLNERRATRTAMWLLLLLLILPVWGAQGAVVFTTLYSFQVFANGEYPSGLVQGSDGKFYGTTSEGGTNGAGTVFKISTNGALTSLYSFTGGNDGGAPNGLVQGSDGSFYGTTGYGGTNDSGSVFKIGTNGALTTLYSFTGGNDGGAPTGLVRGSDGNFYGTTWGGGTNGAGTVFRISTSGALTTLYSFTGSNDGANPAAALVQGSDGYFYGTTEYSGPSGGNGTVFKISANGVLTTLHSFSFTNDGSGPSGLVHGSDGNFYGTTERGGPSGGNGTVFKISTNGAWTRLYAFTNGYDGFQPQGAMVQGDDGNFYGMTSGISLYFGSVFQLTTNGALTTLHFFTNQMDGSSPSGPLAKGSNGWFYGTTFYGGTNGAGNLFKINANGDFTNLYSFPRGSDTEGENPAAGLVQASDGYLYGTAYGGGTNDAGSVFKITTNGALTTLHLFSQIPDGANPNAGLVLGSDGFFYGTTEFGGLTAYAGNVFKINSSGSFSNVYSFGTTENEYPGGIVQGSDGYFYGTTGVDQPANSGTAFRLSTNGALATLYSFTGGMTAGSQVV